MGLCRGREAPVKPTVESLGIDVDGQAWQRSGDEADAIEIALTGDEAIRWVLMRVAGDAAGRVLVYDRHEWECFLQGVRGGEFDDAGDVRRTAARPDEV